MCAEPVCGTEVYRRELMHQRLTMTGNPTMMATYNDARFGRLQRPARVQAATGEQADGEERGAAPAVFSSTRPLSSNFDLLCPIPIPLSCARSPEPHL